MSIQDRRQPVQSVGPHSPSAVLTRAAGGSPAVVLHCSASTPLGLLADALEAAGPDRCTVRPGAGRSLPDPTEIVIVIGSHAPAGVAHSNWLETEVEWLRQADAAGASILGIGSGAQTLALAVGGGIERSRGPQHSWTWIQTAEPELIAPGPWLAWHDHDIQLPTAAQPIAHDARGGTWVSISTRRSRPRSSAAGCSDPTTLVWTRKASSRWPYGISTRPPPTPTGCSPRSSHRSAPHFGGLGNRSPRSRWLLEMPVSS
jgi:GMP synthase-like glutamine amidotransferase